MFTFSTKGVTAGVYVCAGAVDLANRWFAQLRHIP
jgi:hypothetical protein